VFPPLLCIAVEPEHDRQAVGLARYMANTDACWTGRPHYTVRNGRHRSIAGWRCGMRTLPAYVLGPGRAMYEVAVGHGDGWWLAAASAAGEGGRQGAPIGTLTNLGPVRVVAPGEKAARD
jgi:hypothetical protein